MQFKDDQETAAGNLRKAVPEMVRRQIPVTPTNFALWYAFVAGLDERLRQELESNFPQPGLYSEEKSSDLFYQYIIKPLIPDQEEAREITVRMLLDLLGKVNDNADGSRRYSEALKRGIDTLQNSRNPKMLEDTMQALLQDTEQMYAANERFQVELAAARQQMEALQKKAEGEETDAFTDVMTGIGNRRHFDYSLEQFLARPGIRVSVTLVDIDQLARINGQYGETGGDRTLKAVAEVLQGYQGDDIAVARLGGGEYAMALANHSLEDALSIAERARRDISRLTVAADELRTIDEVTASFGVAEQRGKEGPERLLQRADVALYRAKEFGRNQVKAAA